MYQLMYASEKEKKTVANNAWFTVWRPAMEFNGELNSQFVMCSLPEVGCVSLQGFCTGVEHVQ